MKHGQGQESNDGYQYTGNYQDNLKHGYGVENYKKVSIYKNNGKMLPLKYEGEFKNDLKNGKGKLVY